MGLFEAIVLGLAQGLTEFLPVSSTAHLRIIPALAGWADPGAPFTAVTQIGTLIAVLAYYRADVTSLSRAWIRSILHAAPLESSEAKTAWSLLAATIPIAVCGLLFKSLIETRFRSMEVIAAALILLALVLLFAERRSRKNRGRADITFLDTQVIGIAQAFALLPGVSRSGVTLTAGLLRNLRREDAASYSFLLSIPAVALSGGYQLYNLRHQLGSEFGVSLLLATVVAGVSGYLSIDFLLRYLARHSTAVFIAYRIFLGALILILLSSNLIT